ncbi:MAG: ABC transporter permease subunit, partial [Bacteroidota bacterium]
MNEQQKTVSDYRQEVRERWENNPDKHPHRMAHYGYVAFRQPSLLSFFDRGLDSFVGNAVFLEAHRQNTVNFSAASLSTGLLRFGELSGALVLQTLLPLLIFFWGFSVVAGEREDGKLRLVFAQGVSWSEVIIGKAVGLFCASLTVLLPAVLLTGLFLLFSAATEGTAPLPRFGLLVLSYGVYLFLICLLTVWVSTVSKTAKTALLRLIGCWLLFVLVLPKLSQVAGQLL